VWNAERTGQVYPDAGMSVELKAGQATVLPIGPNQHFVMKGRPATERLVLQVRHPKATSTTRSDQPAYRQETATGSSYLQLVRNGQFPHIEQVLTMRR
jgi:sarcosine oxidase gamma subunit